MFIGAKSRKVVIYRNYLDLIWSLSAVYTPILTLIIIVVLFGENEKDLIMLTKLHFKI